MTRKQLRAIRDAMGLTQAEFAAELKISRNSVARMETGGMIITPPMELLIQFVAREAGVHDRPPNGEAGGRAASDKRVHGAETRAPDRQGRRGQGPRPLQRDRRGGLHSPKDGVRGKLRKGGR
jgi:transcriptional regulator with XRE-family HTH domain